MKREEIGQFLWQSVLCSGRIKSFEKGDFFKCSQTKLGQWEKQSRLVLCAFDHGGKAETAKYLQPFPLNNILILRKSYICST